MAREEVNFKSGSNANAVTDLKSCEDREGSLTSRPAKVITITVERIENIKDSKVKEISLTVEFLGVLLNQTDHIPVVDNGAEIQLTSTIIPEELSPQFLDSILSSPIIFTVLDCPDQSSHSPDASAQGLRQLPQTSTASTAAENKRKGSKASRMTTSKTVIGYTVLGICNLDIGSLVTGSKRITETLLVESNKKVMPTDVVSWVKLPKLVVVAETGDEPLLPESVQKLQNVIGITVESAYNVPENIPEGSLFDACILLPTVGDRATRIRFPNGVTTSDPDFTFRKKWLSVPQAEGFGARAKHKISPDTCDIITEISEGVNVQDEIRNSQKQIQWNMWKNCLMLKPDITYFYTKIMKCRTWPIEILLPNKTKEPTLKDKSSKSDKKSKSVLPTSTASGTDHFTAFLNLSPLLYPGVTKVRVAAQLLTYSQADLINKFGSEFALNQLQQPSTATVKAKMSLARSKASVRDSEEKESPAIPGAPVTNENGSPTFIVVEVELLKPFTLERDPEELEKDLKAYFSLKGKINRKVTDLSIAHDSFSASLLQMVSILTREYQNYHLSLSKKSPPEDTDSHFHKYLCKQNVFHQVKATLENKMVHLITEKFGKISCYEEKIPEIYIYLVNEMHKITNGCMLDEEDVSSKNNNDNALWLYAEEAMEEDEYELARDYLLLKLSRNTYNPDNWLDLAVCCVRLGAYDEAVEAVREALSVDFHHQIGLLMYALLMAKISKPNIAELAFKVLLKKYPDFVEGWVALQEFYKTVNNTEGSFVAFKEARAAERVKRLTTNYESIESEQPSEFCSKIHQHDGRYDAATEGKYGVASFTDSISYTEPLSWTINFCPPNCIRMRTTVLLLKLGFCEYATMCLSEELISSTKCEKIPLFYGYYSAANYYLQGRYEEAVILLQQFVKEYGKDCYLWSLIAHCYYRLENHAKALSCYEYVVESFNRPDDIHLVYTRIGFYYIQAGKYSCAKKVFLTACKYSPTPRLWKGLGLSCLMEKEPEEAEKAFSEANYLDDRDPETWAYLAIVNAEIRRLDLFKCCAIEAKKRGLQNEKLMGKIKGYAILNGVMSEDLEF